MRKLLDTPLIAQIDTNLLDKVAMLVNKNVDYFSLTDMARYRNADNAGFVIQNWMRNRNVIRFLGLWERLNNPDFNYLEFEAIEKDAGVNSFVLTPKRWTEMWRENHPDADGNIRDHATLSQLIVLVNLESMNSELIKLGISRAERAIRLNAMAIDQMKKLSEDDINNRLSGLDNNPSLLS